MADDGKRPWLAVSGGVGLVIALVLSVLAGGPAWRGWLAAVVGWSGLGVGGMVLSCLMQLAPGSWRGGVARPAASLSFLAPFGAALVLPLLFALPQLYPWV